MLQGFVQLPADVQLGIQVLIVGIMAVAIQWLITAVPWLAFLSNYAQEWGLLLAGIVITALQNALPTGYEDVSIKGVVFVLAVIGLFVKFLRARGVRGFAE